MSWKENFIKGLIENSEHKNWDEAIKEWILENIFFEASNCLCGHDILENCVIRNKLNNKEIIVGNCCINKIPSYSEYNHMSLAFKALKKNKVNASLIDLSRELGYINEWEHRFMMDVWRKRNFTEKQRNYYTKISEKIVVNSRRGSG